MTPKPIIDASEVNPLDLSLDMGVFEINTSPEIPAIEIQKHNIGENKEQNDTGEFQANIKQEEKKTSKVKTPFKFPKISFSKIIIEKFPKLSNIDTSKYEELIFALRSWWFYTIILGLSMAILIFSFIVYKQKSDFTYISKYYTVMNDIKVEDARKVEFEKNKPLADALKFWIKQAEWNYYPQWGYLYTFSKLFPDNISDLNLLTFIEWWSSEFVSVWDKTIRIDSDIIKSFKKEDSIIENGSLKWYSFSLNLQWDSNKINDFLFNLRYNNKIPKEIKKYKEENDVDTGEMKVEMQIIFYITKK